MKTAFIVLGLLLASAGLALLLINWAGSEQLFRLIETRLSSDHHIEPITKKQIIILLYCGGTAALSAGAVALSCSKESLRLAIKKALTEETVLSSHNLLLKPKATLMIASLLGALISAFYVYIILTREQKNKLYSPYGEDGIFENLTVAALLLSVILICKAAVSLRSSAIGLSASGFTVLQFFYLFLMMSFFLVAMEEISWGQRIFGWSTPSSLQALNYQDETNLHNIRISGFDLNHILQYSASFAPIPVLISALLRIKCKKSVLFDLLLPHPSLIFLALMILPAALTLQGELLEELIALFCLFYSLRASRIGCGSAEVRR